LCGWRRWEVGGGRWEVGGGGAGAMVLIGGVVGIVVV